MTRRVTTPILLALTWLFGLFGPTAAQAQTQTFKVEKFDIKGDGGTDYVAVESTSGRVFVSRGTHMMVVEGATGKVVGDILNTPGVHGAAFSVKANHGFTTNSGDQTVPTVAGAKTIAVDPKTHNAYLFQPERGPAPPPAAGAPAPAPGRGRGPQGPIVASWFVVIRQ